MRDSHGRYVAHPRGQGQQKVNAMSGVKNQQN